MTARVYAYVSSKQNVRDKVGPLQDKVGPLEDTAGNIISQGFLMAEDLNGYFSSVFTELCFSSLPVPDAPRLLMDTVEINQYLSINY